MITSWKNTDAKEVYEGKAPRAIPADILKRARRLLAQLDGATSIGEMGSPSGNWLHKLEGTETWAVSVNKKYRVTFAWGKDGPEDVWLGDYH